MRLRRGLAVSLDALLAHRLRAALAVISVSIGVAAVVLTGAVGQGAQEDVRRNIESAGSNLLVVRPALVKRFTGRKELQGTVTTLHVDDYDAIVRQRTVAGAAPTVEGAARVKAGVGSMMTTVRGTTSAFPVVRRFQVQRGRFFDAGDDARASRVAVLGARVASSLFDGDPVGKEVRIRGVPYDVIGVLAAKGVVADGDEDNQVLVPMRTAARRVFNVTWLNAVFVSVRDPDSMASAATELGALLSSRHRPARDGEPDFEVQNTARFFNMQRDAAESLTTFGTALGTVALAVGGIGILGLMLLSVRERTPEIGLRVAVGATPRDILMQFLLEAAMLSLAGWAIGVGLGTLGAGLVKSLTSWPVVAPIGSVLASLGTALIIGLGFGVVPARNASKVPPVRALLAT